MNLLSLACSLTLAQDLPPTEATPPAAEQADVQSRPDQVEQHLTQLRLLAAEQRIATLERELALRAAEEEEREAVGRGGGVVVPEGQLVPKAVAFGGPVCVKGRVLNDAVSFGDDVLVESGARVEGNAVSFGGRVIVEPGGSVRGDQVSYANTSLADGILHSRPLDGAGDKIRQLARQLVLMFGFAGAGVLMVGALPEQIDRVESQLVTRPFIAGLLGIATTGIVGVLAALFTITLIGIPIALALLAGLLSAWLVGFVAFCKACGDRLPVEDVRTRRWVAFLAGVLAVAFVGALPWVGRITLVLVGFGCVGAALSTRFGTTDPK